MTIPSKIDIDKSTLKAIWIDLRRKKRYTYTVNKRSVKARNDITGKGNAYGN